MTAWGFNAIGLIVGLAVLAPNALLAIAPPAGGVPRTPDGGPLLTALERVGQVGCLALLAATVPQGSTWWLVPTAASIAVYWALWGRYLLTGRRFAELYAPLGRLPIPMAVFPVLAFASAALWVWSPWLGIAVILLAIGHLGNSAVIAARLHPSG